MSSVARVTELITYPVKSIAGISLEHAHLERRGLRHDRRFMLAQPEDGLFISQRSDPKLALVHPSLQGDHLLLRSPLASSPLRVPLTPSRGEARVVDVWDDRVEAIHIDDGGWFARVIGRPCELVYMPDASERAVDPRYAGERDAIVSFADGYPTLLISEASLAELNRRLPSSVDMRRFRPNIVVEGCAAHAEDGWRRFRVGSVNFSGVKPCSRCILTTVDPDTGARGALGEPLATLATYRREEGRVLFGQNLLHDGPGELRVGDAVVLRDEQR